MGKLRRAGGLVANMSLGNATVGSHGNSQKGTNIVYDCQTCSTTKILIRSKAISNYSSLGENSRVDIVVISVVPLLVVFFVVVCCRGFRLLLSSLLLLLALVVVVALAVCRGRSVGMGQQQPSRNLVGEHPKKTQLLVI